MKYFIDTEFIERLHKPLFGKARHVIDLISVGIVAEDGREYHAISSEYRYKDADDWVKENVIVPLYISTVHGDARNCETASHFHKYYGKSNKRIAQDIIEFCKIKPELEWIAKDTSMGGGLAKWKDGRQNPVFYGYYADYDWVLLCSLFGRMIDLPTGFPMYCRDLKQTQDEEMLRWAPQGDQNNPDLLACFKHRDGYPKQSDEHNALADARWNRQLYEFLKSI